MTLDLTPDEFGVLVLNFDELSFNEFADFFCNVDRVEFEHRYEDVVYRYGNATALNFARFCREFRLLAEQYTIARGDKILWDLNFFLANEELQNLLWDEEIPLGLRQDCVYAMGDLFANYFAINDYEFESCYMWWDFLAYGKYHTHGKSPNILSHDEREIQQAMFDTICRVLQMNSAQCQTSAIHGIGHLLHPCSEKILQEYLEDDSHDASNLLYAEHCLHAVERQSGWR